MLHFLKRHPFPVVAHFERVVAVSFAFPETTLKPLVPAGLEMDCYEGHGFLTAALVWTRHLRPAGFPEFLGQDFFLAGYRIFTRLRDESGRNLRGLKILRSETDKHRMVTLGNLMTGYNYREVRLKVEKSGTHTRVLTSLPNEESTLDITFDAETPVQTCRSVRHFQIGEPREGLPVRCRSHSALRGMAGSWSSKASARTGLHGRSL